MSLLSTVELFIKSYKVHQAEINGSIQLYSKLLQSLLPQAEAHFEESKAADDSATGEDASLGETEDIDLLERALEKALQVRTGTEPSKKDSFRNKLSGPQMEPVGSSVGVTQSSAPSRGSQTTVKLTSKTSRIPMKGHRKPGPSICSNQASRLSSSSDNSGQSKATEKRPINQNNPALSAVVVHHQAVSGPGSVDHISTLLSKNKTVRNNVLHGDDLGKAASVSTPSSNYVGALSRSDKSGSFALLQLNGVYSDQTTKWKSLRSKQNRLWDKVIAQQRKLVPGRSRFMERMRATFPMEWPCGSPDETRALVDRVTHRGRDLATQTSKTAPKPGGKENHYNPTLTREGLKQTAEELQNLADQVKQEWKAWDRWRPEGGCLCTTGANGVWEDGIAALLPLTITYTREAEIQELERLRMRVALLQHEICLEQGLLDSLSYQVSSIHHGPGCPNPSVLRGLYSLLGEGGERFPAIVLDSEPD